MRSIRKASAFWPLSCGPAFSLRRVREPDELQDIFDLPVVGYVPESGNLRKENAGPQLRGPNAEAFRMLRTTLLYFNVDKNIRSLLVTSAAPKEGKTTVS